MQSTYSIEIVKPSDASANYDVRNEAKNGKIAELADRSSLKIVCKEDVPADTTFFLGRLPWL